MKKDSKIAIVAGGTGGHIFPAISLLEQLISEKKEIIFFSDKRVKNIVNENKNLFKNKKVILYTLEISRNFLNFFNFFGNLLKIFNILRKNNPKVVVGFGGYTSIPFLLYISNNLLNEAYASSTFISVALIFLLALNDLFTIMIDAEEV